MLDIYGASCARSARVAQHRQLSSKGDRRTSSRGMDDPIRNYLQLGTLPEDKREAKKLSVRAKRFLLWDGLLYKRSFTHPLLRCLSQQEAEKVLKEVHSGVCGNHPEPTPSPIECSTKVTCGRS